MRKIAVTSGKGGTGTSCVAAYTGIALAKAGLSTLLLELGAGYRTLDLVVDVSDTIVYDITDVFDGRCEVPNAILSAKNYPHLHLLPAGISPPRIEDASDYDVLFKILRDEGYDYVIADGVDFSLCSPQKFDTVLQVLTPDTLSIRACTQQARTLYEMGADNLRLVINSVAAKVLPMYNIRDFDDIIDQVGIQLIAVIPESPKLKYSSNNGKPLDEESLTKQVFDSLAARLRGERSPLLIR